MDKSLMARFYGSQCSGKVEVSIQSQF